MPIPKTWTEELVYEWLSLKGYFVERNMRLKSLPGGGVSEADIVGVRTEDEHLRIMHIETGQLAGRIEDKLDSVLKKFTKDRTSVVEAICRERIDPGVPTKYSKLYIATYANRTDEWKEQLEKEGIEFKLFWKFLDEDVRATIEEWKDKEVERGRRKSKTDITLPEPCWLLNLVDYLCAYCPKNV